MPPLNPEKAGDPNLDKRRLDAVRAMEGELGRKRREVREYQRRERELSETTAKEKAAKAAESAQWQAAQEKAKTEKVKREETKAATARVNTIKQSEAFVDELKSTGAALNPMRTLKTDMARAVKEEGVSIATIAMSEQARGRLGTPINAAATQPKSNRTLLFVLLLLLAASMAAGAYLWWSNTDNPEPLAPAPSAASPSLIFAELEKRVDLAGLTKESDLLAKIAAEASALDLGTPGVKRLYFTRGASVLSWPELARTLGLTPPEALTRVFGSNYLFGVYFDGNANHRFLILTTTLFDQAFAGLLSWEETMPDELIPLLHDLPATQPAPVTTDFKDKLVLNKDARYTENVEGRTMLFYAFLDQHSIAITPDERTFAEIFTRFTNVR